MVAAAIAEIVTAAGEQAVDALSRTLAKPARQPRATRLDTAWRLVRDTGMTAREIAAAADVSASTITGMRRVKAAFGAARRKPIGDWTVDRQGPPKLHPRVARTVPPAVARSTAFEDGGTDIPF